MAPWEQSSPHCQQGLYILLEEGTSASKLCKYLELGKGKYATYRQTPKTCGNYAATAIQLPNKRKEARKLIIYAI
jgi:hypothetical protein